jgi:hypothetical protein
MRKVSEKSVAELTLLVAFSKIPGICRVLKGAKGGHVAALLEVGMQGELEARDSDMRCRESQTCENAARVECLAMVETEFIDVQRSCAAQREREH